MIAVGEPRKHHYIPVFYQQYFTNGRGLLWVYDRRLHTYKELSPRSVCFEKDLYALKPESGPRDRRMESEVLSYVDSFGSSAISELLSGQLNDQTIPNLAYFIAVQFNRLPSVGRAVSDMWTNIGEDLLRGMTASVGRMESVLERYAQDTGKPVEFSAESLVESVRGGGVKAAATERPFITGIIEQAEGIASAILQLDWQTVESPNSTGFLISDCPVVVVPPRGVNDVGFHVPGAVKYFPLSRTRCLRLGDLGGGLTHRRVGKRTVQVINYNIAANSERFIMGPEKAQLASVVRYSESLDEDLTPRFTTEIVQERDGSLQKMTFQPRRYFYGKGTRAP